MSEGPARLVVRTPNWLGDAVMALPALAAVRQALPKTTIAIAAPSGIASLFEENTAAAQDELIAVTGAAAEVPALAAGRFDAALLLPNSFRAAWTARQANIPERWGYGGNLRGWVLTRAVAKPRGRVHQSEYYSALVRGVVGEHGGADSVGAALAAAPGPSTVLTEGAAARAASTVIVRPATAARAAALLEREGIPPGTPLVGFAPGAAYGHAKRWPPERVAQVIQRVAGRGVVSLLFGAAGDRSAGREIESTLPPGARVVNLIGRTDLRLLAGLVARCAAFVSNDSGAMHLAAALGVPVVAPFGPTDDRVTSPLGDHDVLIHPVFCRPCMLRECPIDHRCMKGLTVDAVFGAVSRRLDARGPA